MRPNPTRPTTDDHGGAAQPDGDPDGCTGAANIVDKILAISEGGNPRDPRNLRAVCHNCHNVETQKQAKRGRNSWKRTPERHPGFKR